MQLFVTFFTFVYIYITQTGWNIEIIESLNSRKYKELTYYSSLKKHIDTSKKSTKGGTYNIIARLHT